MSVLTIERVNALPGVLTASALYIVKASDTDKVDLYFTSEDGLTARHVIRKEEIVAMLLDGDGVVAEQLKFARNINGVAFDGTEDIVISAVDSTPRVAVSQIGAVNGIAPLDGDSKIPSVYLPSYVDDVLEYNGVGNFPVTGEVGKIYVDTSTENGKTYRWGGSTYIVITGSPGSSDEVAEGTVNKYFTVSRVLGSVLTGLSTATNAVVDAADTVLVALGKLQKQITDHLSDTNNPHAVTAAETGAPTTGGTGATGTWDIDISGNSATSTASNGITLTVSEW